jgi:hypothetical protein
VGVPMALSTAQGAMDNRGGIGNERVRLVRHFESGAEISEGLRTLPVLTKVPSTTSAGSKSSSAAPMNARWNEQSVSGRGST